MTPQEAVMAEFKRVVLDCRLNPKAGCTLTISRPRALTASSAASNERAPAATRAPYSPRLWPMTRSGSMP